MKNIHLIFVFVLIASCRVAGQNIFTLEQIKSQGNIIRNWDMHEGDDFTWSQKHFDDSAWAPITVHENNDIHLPKAKNYWLRANVTFRDSIPTDLSLSLILARIVSAYEVYWDGILLHRSGQVGTVAASEIPGNVFQQVDLPRPMASGDHTIAIRISNHYFIDKNSYGVVVLGIEDSFNRDRAGTNYSIIFITAVFLTASIFNLILYFGFNKNIALLFFSFFCLSQAIKTIIEPFSLVDNTSLVVFENMRLLVHPLVILGGIFLNAFLLYKFVLAKRNVILITYSLVSLASYFLITARTYIVLMIIAAFIIVLYALYKKSEGAILSLMGLTGFTIFTFLGYLGMINYGYFLGIIVFIIFMIISIAKQIARQNNLHNQAMIRASRLESQMLKKNIQPHFILNSLTSLQELVEQSPGKAVQFIDSLAEEFQVISKISGEKLIPITDELKICEAHLKIMGYRKNAEFKIGTNNITGDEMIPPAIFHTLVENGLTHGYGNKRAGYFELTKEELSNGIRYKLYNDSDLSDGRDVNYRGTGLKYVEARLEETYPGMWTLNSAQVQNGWQVVIEIYYGRNDRK